MSSKEECSRPETFGPRIAYMMKVLGQVWMTEKLTKEDWRWYRAQPCEEPSVERVVRQGRNPAVLASGQYGEEVVLFYKGEWAGPLELLA
jgi:hypothetical protein